MSNLPKEVREAMIAAVVENIGPVVGTPEYLARPGNVERLEARRRNAAASHIDAALSALEAAGYAVVPKEPTRLMLSCGVRDYVGGERYARDHEYCDANFIDKMRAAWTAMLSASQEQSDG